MNNLKIALLLFTIILSFNSLNAQEEQSNNEKNIEIKNSEIVNDTIKKDTIPPVNLRTNFVKDSS